METLCRSQNNKIHTSFHRFKCITHFKKNVCLKSAYLHEFHYRTLNRALFDIAPHVKVNIYYLIFHRDTYIIPRHI